MYLTIVMDLYTRMTVGWSMQATLAQYIVFDDNRNVSMELTKNKSRHKNSVG